MDLGGSGARGFGFRWIYIDLIGFKWIYMDLFGFGWIYKDLGPGCLWACGGLWRPVAGCGAGVVAPKERLLQSQNAVSEAWRPVGCRLGGWD